MRSLISKAATVPMIVMASGVAAGQKQSGPIPALLTTQTPQIGIARNHSAVFDRIWSFDANRDELVARDELPERMEGLVSRGDKNQDGFLNRDEVSGLVDTRPSARQFQRFSARSAATLAEIVVDLKLPPLVHARAMDLVSEQTVSRTVDGRVSVSLSDELSAGMRVLLDDEDYENFVAAATRLRNTPRIFGGGIVGGVGGAPAPPPRQKN